MSGYLLNLPSDLLAEARAAAAEADMSLAAWIRMAMRSKLEGSRWPPAFTTGTAGE
jgi:hypothetical protein